MLAPSPTVVLALVFCVGATATAQPRAAPCEAGPRRIELTPEPSEEVPELCISAELSTIISFNGAELFAEGVSLEGRERFTRVEVGATMLRLVPSARVTPGERFKLTVRFKDGAAPTSVVFWLGVYPGQVEPLVEVYRHQRTVESCQQEVKEKQAQLRQCREENARLHAEKAGPRGLSGLLATGLMNGTGVAGKDILLSVAKNAPPALTVKEVRSYRSARGVAVELLLESTETVLSWKAIGAELVVPGRRTLREPRLWQEASSGRFRVVVEAEATEAEAQGSFTLKVRSEDATRSLSLTGVTFP